MVGPMGVGMGSEARATESAREAIEELIAMNKRVLILISLLENGSNYLRCAKDDYFTP